ncbi:MAG: glycosyltransferase family 4 protein [Acidimicrobiales bacterium]
MRTLHLLASADRRGAEVFAVLLAERLAELGHEAEVVALRPPGSPGGGLDVDVVPGLPRPRAVAELRRRARRADVVLGHGSRGLVAGTAATLGTRTPLVYRSIGDPTFWGASRARQVRVGLQLRRAAQVTALWPAAAEAIARQYGVAPERITVVPNAADERRFSPATAERRAEARRSLGLAPDAPVVLYLGALAPEKRVPLVVESVGAVEGAVLLIAGDGPERDSVARAAERSLPGRHHLLGVVQDVEPLLAASDGAILLSTTEGQPGVAVEAGLSALPLLCTDVGGVSSVVVDGTTGRLVPADASPTEVAAALRAMLDDAPTLGAAAAERCRGRFSLDVVAAQFDEVLRAAAGRP